MLPKETIFEFVSNFEGPIKECYDALYDFQSKFNPFRNRPNSNELETIKESLMEYLKTYKYNT